jgi:hypothetical protein
MNTNGRKNLRRGFHRFSPIQNQSLQIREIHVSFFWIRVHPCPSVLSSLEPFVYQGLLAGWTATVSGTVSKAAG